MAVDSPPPGAVRVFGADCAACPSPSCSELVEQFLSGTDAERAAGALYARCVTISRPVTADVLRGSGDPAADARDAATHLLMRVNKWQRKAAFCTWANPVVRNWCLDQLRARRPKLPTGGNLGPVPAPAPSMLTLACVSCIDEFVGQLKPAMRQVWERRYRLENAESPQAIANSFGVHERSVFYWLKAMRIRLNKICGETCWET